VNQCIERIVTFRELAHHEHQCPRTKTVRRGDKWYCWQHDPVARLGRRAVAHTRAEAEATEMSNAAALRQLKLSEFDNLVRVAKDALEALLLTGYYPAARAHLKAVLDDIAARRAKLKE